MMNTPITKSVSEYLVLVNSSSNFGEQHFHPEHGHSHFFLRALNKQYGIGAVNKEVRKQLAVIFATRIADSDMTK